MRAAGLGQLRALNPLVRRVFLGLLLSALGSGLTMPYLYVYLTQVRHLPIVLVGWVFAWMGLLGFAVSVPVGTAIDRFGPLPVLLSGLGVQAAATAMIGWVTTPGQAFAVAALVVIGSAGSWPAGTALLTRLVPDEVRQTVFGVQFMTLNAGLGIGGAISSMVIDVGSVASFQRLYLLDALTYLAQLLVLATLPAGTGRTPSDQHAPGEPAEPGAGGWGLVLADRVMRRVIGLSVLAVTFGYAQVDAGFAAFAVAVAGVSPRWLGWAFAANTVVIVIGQLVVLRAIAGRRHSRMMALGVGIWSLSWLVTAAAAPLERALEGVAVVAGLALFGLGETLWAPAAPALVNALADEHVRGRYNALHGMAWTVGSIIGPSVAGMLIGHGLATVWVVTVVGGTALAALGFVLLRRHLTDEQDGLGQPATRTG